MSKTKEVDGRTWISTPCNPTDGWECYINDRISVITWQFGDIHQCGIGIWYDKLKPSPGFDHDVRVCLDAQPTELDAMRHGVEWAENYIKNGPQPIEQVFKDCFEHYPTLFRTRIDVIEQIFYMSGNGYEWLDGAIVNVCPEDYLSTQRTIEKRKNDPEEQNVIQALTDILKMGCVDEKTKEFVRDAINRRKRESDDLNTPRPFPDDGRPRVFRRVTEYSKIMRVPDDVRPEWLALAYEAAIILRDRSDVDGKEKYKDDAEVCIKNREIGARVVRELEARFPQLKGNA